MDFQKMVPTKLARKFDALSINSVESLLSNYEKLIQSKGFGGIYSAELQKFMNAEGIQIPASASAAKKTFLIEKDSMELILEQIAEVLEFGYKDFVYPIPGRLKFVFNQLHVTDLPSLQEKFNELLPKIKRKKTSFQNFITWIKDTTSFYKDVSAPTHGTSYLEMANQYLEMFSSKLDNKHEYIFKAHVMESKTLSHAAIFQGLTRQRIDQILQKVKAYAAAFLLGETSKDLPRVDLALAKMLFRLNRSIKQNKLLSANDATIYFNEYCTAANVQILERLGKLFGFNVMEFKNGETPFCVSDTIKQSYIRKLITAIEEVLQKNVYPANSDDIVIAVKKNFDMNADKNQILYILDHYSCIEKVGSQYGLKLRYLNTIADKAVRILHNAQCEMKFQAITKEINRITISEGGKPYDNITASNFIQNKDLVSLGKTGFWTLRKFTTEENTFPIKQQIIRLIQSHGGPVSLSTIKNDLSTANYYAPNTIYMTLMSDEFAHLKGDRYILSQWKDLYKSELKPRRTRSPKNMSKISIRKQICSEVKEIFVSKGVTQMDLTDTQKQLQKTGYKAATIYAAISSDSTLKKEKVGRSIILHYDYRNIA